MKHLTRREMLKAMGLATAGTTLAACAPAATPTAAPTSEPTKAAEATQAPEATKAPEPTKPPEPTATAPKAAPTKVIFVESWFGVPQYADSISPVTEALSAKAQAEGVNVEFSSMILDDHANKYPVLYASGTEFTCAFDAPWYKMNTLRDQKALVALEDLIASSGAKLKEEITEKIYNFNFDKGPDGNKHLYGIPTAFYYGGTTGVTIREDLRTKFNLPAPDSSVGWSSFEPYLKGIAENVKGMVPFANTAKYSPVGIAHLGQGYWTWNPVGDDVGITMVLKAFDKGEYKFIDSETNEGMIERIKMLRSWWEKGWMNKADLPSTAGTETIEKDFLVPQKASSCMQNDAEVKDWQEFDPMMKQAEPSAQLKGYDMTGLATGKFKALGALKQWNFVVFNATAPKESQEAGVAWFNWLASSQDNIDIWLMGIEGTNWKKEDNMRYSDIASADATTNYRRQWYVSGISGRFQRLAVNIAPEAEAIIKANANEANFVFNPYEGFSLDRKPVEDVLTKIGAIRDEASHGMNSGQSTADASIAKYKKMLDDAGRQKIKEVVQKQVDDYIAGM